MTNDSPEPPNRLQERIRMIISLLLRSSRVESAEGDLCGIRGVMRSWVRSAEDIFAE